MKNTAVRHDIGKRPSQEDTYLTYLAKGIKTAEEARNFLEGFHISTLETTKNYTDRGSCAISTVYLPQTKQIVWSSVGDSQATVFVWRSDAREVGSKVLNELHKAPYNWSIGADYLFNSETRQGLAVNHAYGDNNFEDYGLSHNADYGMFDLHRLHLGESDKVFLMTSCDGYFEWASGERNYKAAIKKVLKDNQKPNTDEILEACFRIAKEKSYDNLTAFLTELTDKNIGTEDAIVVQVFDGHGGSEVSKAIVTNAVQNILQDTTQFLEMNSSEDITSLCEFRHFEMPVELYS